jgi:hypothetical protein
LTFSSFISHAFLDLEQFVAKESINSVSNWTESIPVEFSYFLSGAEFRLNNANEDLDFFLSLSRVGNNSRAIVEDIACNDTFFNKMSGDGTIVQNFLKSWLNGKQPYLENIWMEFDRRSSDSTNELGYPSIFFGIDSDAPTKRIDFISNILDSINSKFEVQSKKFELLTQAIDKHKLSFSHIGLMLSRKNDSIRLFITGAEKANLVQFFHEIGIKIDENAFEKLFSELKLYFDTISFQLDVDENGELGHKIGLECFILNKPKQLYLRQLELIESYLMEDHSCIHQRAASMAKLTNLDLPHPEIRLSSNNHSTELLSIRRGLHHIKFNFIKDRVTDIKSYIWFEGDWSGNSI